MYSDLFAEVFVQPAGDVTLAVLLAEIGLPSETGEVGSVGPLEVHVQPSSVNRDLSDFGRPDWMRFPVQIVPSRVTSALA